MRRSPVLLLSLMMISTLMVPLVVATDDVEAADVGDIGLRADQPDRDRAIAGIVILALSLSVLAAIYHISRKEGL